MVKRFVTCFVFLLLGASVAYGQADFTVEGTVTEARSGDPLPGANVVVQGTSIGTSADAQGGYSLEVPSEDATLVFSFVGYNTKETPVRGRSEINVSLQVASLKADELVVIGYGTQQREDLTGSVSSIDAEAIELDGPTYSVDQALQGRVAGLQAVFSGGTPGSGADISIRGASSINAGNDPLFVVDGLPSNAPPDPADIQSIEVLKDASATAIYGARAANGVILITTKSGEAGDLEVSYTGEAGMQEVSNKLDLLTPQEYKRVLNGIIDDGGGDPELQVGDIPNGGTNWQDQILQRAPVQNHDISFSGGNDQTQFYTSIGIFDQQGIVRSSSFERYRARINIEHQIEEEFNLGVRLNAHQRNDRGVRNNFGSTRMQGPSTPLTTSTRPFPSRTKVATTSPPPPLQRIIQWQLPKGSDGHRRRIAPTGQPSRSTLSCHRSRRRCAWGPTCSPPGTTHTSRN
jgi:TonB-linked SusC/RagA family outer membrane protein